MTEPIYGFPCVENPHDFWQDTESCTPEEIAFWQDAKHRWDAGEREVRGARCETLYDPQRWWFFASIVGRVFEEQETMFGHYGKIVVRVPVDVAWWLAFEGQA